MALLSRGGGQKDLPTGATAMDFEQIRKLHSIEGLPCIYSQYSCDISNPDKAGTVPDNSDAGNLDYEGAGDTGWEKAAETHESDFEASIDYQSR